MKEEQSSRRSPSSLANFKVWQGLARRRGRKIGLVCPIAKQAFVRRLLSDLWFQERSGSSLRDDVLLARAGALSFSHMSADSAIMARNHRPSSLGA